MEKSLQTGWEYNEKNICDRCGNVEVSRAISLPYRKAYVQLCFICFWGLKAYFERDDGEPIKQPE